MQRYKKYSKFSVFARQLFHYLLLLRLLFPEITWFLKTREAPLSDASPFLMTHARRSPEGGQYRRCNRHDDLNHELSSLFLRHNLPPFFYGLITGGVSLPPPVSEPDDEPPEPPSSFCIISQAESGVRSVYDLSLPLIFFLTVSTR